MATPQQAPAEFGDFPEAWLWDEHGPFVSGTFVKFDRGQTRDFGPKTIVVLDLDGEQRSIWLTAKVLYGKFRDELRNRPEHQLEAGERITIKRLDKVESADAIGPYWKFGVIFHDAPEPSVEELFDLEEDEPLPAPPPEPEPAAEKRARSKEKKVKKAGPDDDIPF